MELPEAEASPDPIIAAPSQWKRWWATRSAGALGHGQEEAKGQRNGRFSVFIKSTLDT